MVKKKKAKKVVKKKAKTKAKFVKPSFVKVEDQLPQKPKYEHAGQPTKYDKKYNSYVDDYLELNVDEVETNRWNLSGQHIKVRLPTIDGFALYIGVPRTTVYEWKEAHQEFSYSLGRIVNEQKKRLLNMGLSGHYNPTIAKLILSSDHGMREKSDVTSDDKPIGISALKDLDETTLRNIATGGPTGTSKKRAR